MTQMAGVAMETDMEEECGLHRQQLGSGASLRDSVQRLLPADGGG